MPHKPQSLEESETEKSQKKRRRSSTAAAASTHLTSAPQTPPADQLWAAAVSPLEQPELPPVARSKKVTTMKND